MTKREFGEQQPFDDADVIGRLWTHPEVLAMLEPLLTDDQIDMLTREADADAEQTEAEARVRRAPQRDRSPGSA